MAFMPFPIQARSRQSAPNYTPQLIQQTGSDILGAFLAMMQMKQSGAESEANRKLTATQLVANTELADKAQKFSERRFDEFEKKTLEIQTRLMEAGLSREEAGILAQVAGRQKTEIDEKFSRAAESLPANLDEAINVGMENYSDVREGLRSLSSQYRKGMGIGDARTQLQQILQQGTSKLLADPDPTSQIAGLRVLGTEIERLNQWAPADLRDTINKASNYLGELQTAGLSPSSLMNRLHKNIADTRATTLAELSKGHERLAGDYYSTKDFPKTRLGYSNLSPTVDTSLTGLMRGLPARQLNVGPLSFDPVQGVAQTVGPKLKRIDESWGEALGGEGASFMNLLYGDNYWAPGNTADQHIPVTQTDPGTISRGAAAKMAQEGLANISAAFNQIPPAAPQYAPQIAPGQNTADVFRALIEGRQ